MAETIWNSAVSVYHFMMDNLVVINILLSLVIVFFQRRSPQTVWTWLLLLYFIPILGFVLYLLIGQDFHKSRMFKAKEIEGEIKYAVRRQEETIYRRRLRLTNPAVARYRDLILYNLEAGQAVLTDNNDVRIYTDGKEKFKALLEEMQKAKKYIHFQYYIIRCALFLSPAPSFTENVTDPPIPIRAANEDKSVMIGAHTPAPARESPPIPGIFPI